eukprot:56432_1
MFLFLSIKVENTMEISNQPPNESLSLLTLNHKPSLKPRRSPRTHGADTDRVLYTDNPNNYLCDPDFLYEMNEDPLQYHFTCLYQRGALQCADGYKLKCLASATYGSTSGACNATLYDEVIQSPFGCGFSYEEGLVTCQEDSFECEGNHYGEVDECFNEVVDEWVYTDSPCTDCVPMCECGLDSPQFYNVADCFGDPLSSVCLDDPDDALKSAYLPKHVWNKYCKNKNGCHLNFTSPAATTCYDSVGLHWNEYWDGLVVNGENTVLFNDFDEVIQDYVDPTNGACAIMELKVLAVCEKD